MEPFVRLGSRGSDYRIGKQSALASTGCTFLFGSFIASRVPADALDHLTDWVALRSERSSSTMRTVREGQLVISRKLAGVSAASVGAATAAAALLLGTVPGSAVSQSSSTGSAYGVAAKGAVPIGPTPQIAAPPDGNGQLVEVPGVGLLEVAAAGNTSSAAAARVALAELVDARAIEATCDNGVGTVSILDGNIAGTELPSAPGANEEVEIPPFLSVVLNRQTDNPDRTRTIEAVVLSLAPSANLDDQIVPSAPLNQTPGGLGLPDLNAVQDVVTVRDFLEDLRQLSPDPTVPLQENAGLQVIISSATCGTDVPVAESPAPGEVPAPAPDVVETQLPVTH